MKIIRKVTIPKLIEMFKQIDWEVKPRGHDFFLLYDHTGVNTGFNIWSDRFWKDGNNYSINFYFKDINVELLSDDCVSVFSKKNKSVFINFANYEKEK